MPTAIAMLMRNAPPKGRGDDAQAQLARDYPSLVLILDTAFTFCSEIAHAYRRRRTRRILEGLPPERQIDIGFAPEDFHNGRLDAVLRKQRAAARPHGSWARIWRAAFAADRSRKALAALGHDELHALSEQGLKARREAQHDHSGCTCRTSGAHP